MSFIIVPAIGVVCVGFLCAGYVKAPPDKAYIISGMRKHSKILIGRAGIRVPFFERMDKLYLGQITVDINTEQFVPTNDFINVKVDAVAKVRINPEAEGINLAAKNFLNKTPEEIAAELVDTLQGNMREIIGTLTLKEINTNRDAFSDEVMNKASKDMEKLGIEILACNIQNVNDEDDLIKDLGADNTSKIRMDAQIAKAQADRNVAIAQSEAAKETNDARVASETVIAEKNNELEIRRAELKKISATKRAEAEAAYDIQVQEQQRTLGITTVNAEIARTERESELRAREVDVARQVLEADVRAKADADKYKVQMEADARLYERQKEAEAKLYEQTQNAEAEKAKAEAAKFAKLQEAEGIRAVGQATADSILAKEMAEAQGLNQKAEAMQKYGEAAVTQMVVEALPEIAKNIAEPLSKVDSITMYGEGNTAKLMEDLVKTTHQVTGGIMQGMGINLTALLGGMLGGHMTGDKSTNVNIVTESPNQCVAAPMDATDKTAIETKPDSVIDTPNDMW